MYMPILTKSQSVPLMKKAVGFATLWLLVYSVLWCLLDDAKVLLFTSDVLHGWISLQFIKCNFLFPVLYCGLNGECPRYITPSKFLPISMMAKGAGSNVQIQWSDIYCVLKISFTHFNFSLHKSP